MANDKPLSTREMSERHRERIQVSAIINRLNDHVKADRDLMTSSQVAAAKLLLGKVLPDVKQIEHSGNIDSSVTIIVNKPNAELSNT